MEQKHNPSRPADDLPPETVNAEQDDEASQAQEVADEARGRHSNAFGLSDSEKVRSGDETDEVPDLVDRMRQMESSGRLDLGAFRGERNDDDEEGMFGPDADED